MTLIIVLIILIGYVGVATEHIIHVNKAAVAMFLGVVAWILLIMDGSSYLSAQHVTDFFMYLGDNEPSALASRTFIANAVFPKYAAQICSLVLYLLATITIVNVLNSNGAFDFLTELIRTTSVKRMLWVTAFVTYFISANLDNLTTVALMIVIIRKIIPNKTDRLYFDCIILLAANCGGSFTAIGDITSLMLWTNSCITPSKFAMGVFLPSLVALVIPTWIVSKKVPDHIRLQSHLGAFNGDDYVMKRWQRIVMLVVGLGGLWFIPTFHVITDLPPFVGALCVLSILWVIEEIFMRKFLKIDSPSSMSRVPKGLQYAEMQTLLFIVGVVLSVSALKETGALHVFETWCNESVRDIYVVSILLGAVSSFLDNIPLVLSAINIFPVADGAIVYDDYAMAYTENGAFWQLLSYCGAVGGSIMTIGSTAGFALMKAEGVRLRWYISKFSWIVTIGWGAGLLVFWITEILTK